MPDSPGDRPPAPKRIWRMRQRWSRLLFAHWPIPAAEVQAKLPAGLVADTFDGTAWLGVVPFTMDRVRFRSVGERTFGVPTAHAFPELNLRTYVRTLDGRSGVYFFSLDAGSLLAVIGARIGFGLPYFWARMAEEVAANGTIHYRSERRFGGSRVPASFSAQYRSLGTPSADDDLRRFLTERYALFVRRFGAVQVGHIHHEPWQLADAEAEIATNTLPQSFGFTLPDRPPVLHYSHEIQMQAWTLRRLGAR
ncbi:YqjF family protein [Terriglobus roseus]|uniref:DUF2071 domain-containing protein n=1 Tax=Terriglobus roseus TaxID=392734 RepID=A0A1H4QB40_9BACT|nr:DUF2071 domain-containing protein [Terriglobus roseus]SEC16821.1 hypothetical protein SAMN05443244_2819 [Terriglobus roseus]